MTDEYTAFRSSFWVFFLYINAWSQALAFAIVLLPALYLDRGPLWTRPLIAFFVAVAVGIAMSAVFAWGFVIVFKTYVGPAGLRCTDGFGIYVTVPWDAIRTVRPFNMAGLRYLLLTTDVVRRKIWLPLFLTDRRGFADLVAAHAGDDHPVAAEYRRLALPADDD